MWNHQRVTEPLLQTFCQQILHHYTADTPVVALQKIDSRSQQSQAKHHSYYFPGPAADFKTVRASPGIRFQHDHITGMVTVFFLLTRFFQQQIIEFHDPVYLLWIYPATVFLSLTIQMCGYPAFVERWLHICLINGSNSSSASLL